MKTMYSMLISVNAFRLQGCFFNNMQEKNIGLIYFILAVNKIFYSRDKSNLLFMTLNDNLIVYFQHFNLKAKFLKST